MEEQPMMSKHNDGGGEKKIFE